MNQASLVSNVKFDQFFSACFAYLEHEIKEFRRQTQNIVLSIVDPLFVAL